jgi:CBS domain-containing protein
MKTAKEVLETKGSEVWSIPSEALVYDALNLMAEKNVGALVVLEGSAVKGILSERDYAREVDLKARSSKSTPVKQIMTRKVFYIRPDNTVEECMALMTHKRIRHLPVMDGDNLVGLISIGDVVKTIISEQKYMLRQLEDYIMGEQR